MLFKPTMIGRLTLQDDHYRRVADLCFRHLRSASEQYAARCQHEWICGISNDDLEYGRAQYLGALTCFQFHQSEEYSQSIASVLFAHIWLLSAANYYRLSCKYKLPFDSPCLSIKPIENISAPNLIAQELKLHICVIERMKTLHALRNTISHLVETDPKTAPMNQLDFPTAFRLVKAVWLVYTALLRHYGIQADTGSWAIQANKYSLPRKVP